jgi:hypothetical protein
MKIVNKGSPVRIVGTVCTDESNQARAIDGQLDELVARRAIEPLAPHTQPFPRQVSVKEGVGEGASIVLTPATRMKRRYSLRVGELRRPILDHLAVLLPAGSALSCTAVDRR